MPSNKGPLPPLPGSDDESLGKNKYDGYYKTGARSFWSDNSIERIEDKKYEKHEHKFKQVPTGAQCKVCHFGLVGTFEIRDEKLFFKGESLGI